MNALGKTLLTATLAGWGVLAFSVAQAGEPLGRMASSLIHIGVNPHAPQPALRLPGNRLDLAAPHVTFNSQQGSEAFPAFNHRLATRPESETRTGGLGIGNQRFMSRPEQLVRNFRREGLPVARLFESENSLVHLGLNQKGKPGLWIVEKLH